MNAIELHGVGKHYQISKSDLAADRVAGLIQRILRPWQRGSQRFAALEDISFEVPRGATFGVIGKNGSGKSTLLKLLARVTRPDEGTVSVFGRVGPLIEVGAGFHPELTGAENVFVNGTIMGMSRKEIRRKFESIVQFAELSEFIHTPVKKYSSGMYVRLGFSVAVHSEPEILLVDEVLSVGDAAFQQKSLGRILELTRRDTTVVFVSHNLAQVEQVCQNTMVLNRGRAVYRGDTSTALDRYRQLAGG